MPAAPPPPLDTLHAMGFPPDRSRAALEAANGDFDRALQYLVETKQAEDRGRRADAVEARSVVGETRARSVGNKNIGAPGTKIEGVALRMRSDAAGVSSVMKMNNPVVATKMINNASTGTRNNPVVLYEGEEPKSRPKATMSIFDGPLEELARGESAAIDTLTYVLTTLRDDPTNPKFLSLKTSNPRFKETLGRTDRAKRASEMFLFNIGFECQGEWVAIAPTFDRLRLKNAIAALHRIAKTEAYLESKRISDFNRVLEESQATADDEERNRRLRFEKLLPLIPEQGAAGTTRITVDVSKGSPSLTRKFHSDDTLTDVIHFVGSNRSIVATKLLDDSWRLIDETLLHTRKMTKADQGKTLHALGLWPSATLRVRLADDCSTE